MRPKLYFIVFCTALSFSSYATTDFVPPKTIQLDLYKMAAGSDPTTLIPQQFNALPNLQIDFDQSEYKEEVLRLVDKYGSEHHGFFVYFDLRIVTALWKFSDDLPDLNSDNFLTSAEQSPLVERVVEYYYTAAEHGEDGRGIWLKFAATYSEQGRNRVPVNPTAWNGIVLGNAVIASCGNQGNAWATDVGDPIDPENCILRSATINRTRYAAQQLSKIPNQ